MPNRRANPHSPPPRRTGERTGPRSVLDVDVILAAAGRAPATRDLRLDAAGVRTGGNGAIVVDENLRTSRPSVYAPGDVNGRLIDKAERRATDRRGRAGGVGVWGSGGARRGRVTRPGLRGALPAMPSGPVVLKEES